MKAVHRHLLQLLKASSQYIVPIYQRLYSWDERECAKLWDDIIRAGSHDSMGAHFTGSIVYVDRGHGTKHSSEPDLIIDGQQRVTTVTLILEALARRLEQLPESEREPIDGFSPKKIRARYLLNQEEDGDRQFKLMLSRNDKDALFGILRGVKPPTSSDTRVVDNFAYFQRRLADSSVDLSAVCKGLDKLIVVDVELERGVDNPQLVFEAMNSTGKELTQADLIRNFVLMDLPTKQQTDVYEAFWRPMELEFIGGPETHFDAFVRHYLTIKSGSIPRLDDIYEAFKDHAAYMRDQGEDIETLVKDMRENARRFCAMTLGKEGDPILKRSFTDLAQIGADVVYPFLIEVYADYESQILDAGEFNEIVQMVIAYVFRRAVCRIPTNSLNKTFAGLSSSVHKSQYLDSVKAAFLKMGTYRRFPLDAEFRIALITADLYNFRRRSYLFRKLENFGRKEEVVIEEYTFEHILPQNENLSEEWREALGDDWQAVQEKYLHTLGNLTLTGYNAEYSDRAFTDKRDLPDKGFKVSPLRLNKGLGQLDDWNVEQIEKRATRLADEAMLIWPAPMLPVDVLASFEEKKSATQAYVIEDHPNLLQPPARKALFERFAAAVLDMDPGVTMEFLKLYVAFRAETNFVDLIPQGRRLKLVLNLPFNALDDKRRLAEDLTGKGVWGNGDAVVGLDESSDFTYVMGLVRQAFEHQMSDD
ncbi:MAG: DUF262 and DUF1524 domain-containing protein [Cellulomonadaceae bacterium]|jgi:uncharacterized protein with ParB-like and HNH nuclease domain/predicted transport protein|nr:DUF262 and DUF1524 domain-containing protein [Cellulomonadaceae bacterium]